MPLILIQYDHTLVIGKSPLCTEGSTGHCNTPHLADGSGEAQDEGLLELIRDLPPEKKIALKILLTNL